MSKEIWMPVNGHEGRYEVNNNGVVKALSKIKAGGTQVYPERILKPSKVSGYLGVSFCRLGTKMFVSVHRVVAKAFIPNPQNKPCVNHINGIKNDNRVENLEWCTYSENEKHSYSVLNKVSSGFGRTGSKNTLSKKVKQIKDGVTVCIYFGASEAGRKTGINHSHIIESANGSRINAGGYKWEYVN